MQLEDDPLEVDVESLDQKRSPGMMLEDKERREKDKKDKAGKPISPGKLEQVHTGNLWAYAYEGNRKICGIGKVLSVSRAEGKAVFHVFRPVSDHRLRLYWKPAYEDEPGVEVLGSGSKAVEETVTAKHLLFPVQLHDGVLSPASSRRLDRMNYHFSTDSQQGGQACAALRAPALRSADGQSVSKKLEQFCLAGRGGPTLLRKVSSRRLTWCISRAGLSFRSG